MTLIMFNCLPNITVNLADIPSRGGIVKRAQQLHWNVKENNLLVNRQGLEVQIQPDGFINTRQQLSPQDSQDLVTIVGPVFNSLFSTDFTPLVIDLDHKATNEEIAEAMYYCCLYYYRELVQRASWRNVKSDTMQALIERYYRHSGLVHFTESEYRTYQARLKQVHNLLASMHILTKHARSRSLFWRALRLLYMALIPLGATLGSMALTTNSHIAAMGLGCIIALGIMFFFAEDGGLNVGDNLPETTTDSLPECVIAEQQIRITPIQQINQDSSYTHKEHGLECMRIEHDSDTSSWRVGPYTITKTKYKSSE